MRTEAERQAWTETSERIQGRIRAVTAALEVATGYNAVSEINHFADHNETGLAFEGILLLVSEMPSLDASVGDLIDEVADDMGVPPGLWRLPQAELLSKLREIGLT